MSTKKSIVPKQNEAVDNSIHSENDNIAEYIYEVAKEYIQ